MTNYKITTRARITNNTGGLIGYMEVGTLFTTGEWVKDGRLNIAVGRWIPVGTYEVVTVTPPPDVPPPVEPPIEKEVWRVMISHDGGVTWPYDKYFEEQP